MYPQSSLVPPVSSAGPQGKSAPSEDGDERKSRTLILCFDGTASQYDGDNTNVVKLYSLLQKDDDNDQQLCYYQPGVGTYFNPGMVSPLFQWGAKILDEAFAWYLDAHVRGGYQFLMQNYAAGDRICLFGFSRGAYTARALAGMLHKIGLLPRDNMEQIPFAYKLYTKTDKDSLALAAGFKQTFCRTVEIEFVGVWDTVASVGVLMSRTLPFTTANATIKKFRHALALDEHRVKFLPNFYHRDTTAQKATVSSKQPGSAAPEGSSAKSPSHGLFGKSRRSAAQVQKNKMQQNKNSTKLREGQSPTDSTSSDVVAEALGDGIPGGTDVLEVWFSGCHTDVGGGSVADDVTVSLSDITLRWMVREVVQAQCGIAFDEAALVRANIPESIFRGVGFPLPSQTIISHTPRRHKPTVPEEEGTSASSAEDSDLSDPPLKIQAPSAPSDQTGSDSLDAKADAIQPTHDAFKSSPAWWLLEIVPISYPWQQASGKWKNIWWFHLGRGRQVPVDAPLKIHETVRERMQDPSLKYTPRAKWTAGTETWVS
ncbi:uncharacterized protein TRAVEDRAFT_28448 [Trametes versicolor FP-101664 SS1]|uniref:uncharacterized protein n=1 Tax=Trametes versicolor (strain FP-101664) TaxID=717944 RepID=UPI0004623202|nr:uncharacterized protein TRAVEDRAFT_28448 [Trametes versicolor FP-101664 SS1]EIW59114.1 hypothetical protein TRAVEDRAFT_28448 [Trametes versicolor FP-101664 SS1]